MLEEFQSIAQHLEADYNQSAKIQHAGAKGTTRESGVVSHYLSKHLPRKYALSSGIIVNSAGMSSGQIDIVIYDQFNVPVLQDHSGVKVFFAEQVLGCVEVKSALDVKELKRIVESAAKFAEVVPSAPYFVFAHTSKISAERACNSLQDLVDRETRQTCISGLVALRFANELPFTITSVDPANIAAIVSTYKPEQPYASLQYPTSGEALLSFHLPLLAALGRRMRESREPAYLDYAKAAGFGKVKSMSISQSGYKRTDIYRAIQVLASPNDYDDQEVIMALAVSFQSTINALGSELFGARPQLCYRNGQPTGIEFHHLLAEVLDYAQRPSKISLTPLLRKSLALIRESRYLSEGYIVINQETQKPVMLIGRLAGM